MMGPRRGGVEAIGKVVKGLPRDLPAAVLLTGLLDDGTLGMASVKRQGGVTIAQDPQSAFFPDVPRNAIENVGVHHVLPFEEIAGKLTQMVMEPESVDWQSYDLSTRRR